jgi:hypothetical protein
MSWASGEAFSLGVSEGVVLRCDGAIEGARVGVMLKVDRRVLLRGGLLLLLLLFCELALCCFGWKRRTG